MDKPTVRKALTVATNSPPRLRRGLGGGVILNAVKDLAVEVSDSLVTCHWSPFFGGGGQGVWITGGIGAGGQGGIAQ
jgi:hypothetical protein